MKQILLFFLFACPLLTWAQTANLEQKVTFDYKNVPLEEALASITINYNIFFSYSRDFVALDQEIKWRAKNTPLNKALDRLFDDLDIAYKSIGDQLVLKKRKPKKKRRKKQKIEEKEDVQENNELSGNTYLIPKIEIPEELLLQRYDMKALEAPDADYPTMADMDFVMPDYSHSKLISLEETRIAQVSLFSSVGTNLEESKDITNNLSLNIFWGSNGGVNGVEVGGFVNTVKKDVRGVQIAGLANFVKGDVGSNEWIDDYDDPKTGVQIAGIFNKAKNVQAVQIAGIMNLTQETFVGFQGAGIGNYVGADAKGFQFSGIYNFNEGNAGSQVTGLFNVAEDVEGFQISGLFNKGKHVKKFQLGMINVCDSIDGTTYGLINWVKGGTNSYNRLEINGNELLHVGMNVKMGVPAFYNMFHFGMHFESGIKAWGIGYGIGTLKRWNDRADTNIELSAIHINEGQFWTKKLNMWFNLKLLFNRRFGPHHSIFFGPTMNVMLSNVSNPDRNTFGTQVVPYSLFKTRLKNGNGAQLLHWIGFSVGFRF